MVTQVHKIFMVWDEQLMISNNLKLLDEALEATALFVHVSKSCLININCIVSYSKNEPNYLQMSNTN